jgi:hypothetical protein
MDFVMCQSAEVLLADLAEVCTLDPWATDFGDMSQVQQTTFASLNVADEALWKNEDQLIKPRYWKPSCSDAKYFLHQTA